MARSSPLGSAAGWANLSVWQDIVALEGGRDWWSQIEDALKSKALQHFILVITPASRERAVVRHGNPPRAAGEARPLVPSKRGPGLGDLGKLPRWLGQLYDLDVIEDLQTTLIRVLEADEVGEARADDEARAAARFLSRARESSMR